MNDFDLYKVAASDFTGKSGDTDCLLSITCTGCIWEQGYIVRNIVQDICKTAFICTTQGKCDDLSFCFFDTGFYKIQRKFTGSEDKTGSEFMASQDKLIFICTHNKVPSFLCF